MTETKNKILIIEDDPFLLNMYITKFELEDFLVEVAEDGDKGLALAKKTKPDIILLDIILPKTNGFDVLRNIKKDDDIKDIPVILLTNLSQRDEVNQGIELGARDYLVKAHFMPSEVVEKIKKIINRK